MVHRKNILAIYFTESSNNNPIINIHPYSMYLMKVDGIKFYLQDTVFHFA